MVWLAKILADSMCPIQQLGRHVRQPLFIATSTTVVVLFDHYCHALTITCNLEQIGELLGGVHDLWLISAWLPMVHLPG